MADKRGVFRINTYESGRPVSYLVCAFTDTEAVGFVGATGISGTSAVRVLSPVEVIGLDDPHAGIAPIPVEKAPFDLPKFVSRSDFSALQAQVADLQKQLNAKNTPSAPPPKG